ncbi:hypothetical protein [Jannaschia pohangensis]|uniref:Sulfotransferase family protein n=1 Tax=Jannaschia pohangensis TaxID=390807 RepID=A0A1I3IL48_9RHOB|nr:hypothetical protein [Jannaschia pohangensis]SFI48666.1 hypothetical protein SAMN04488095_1018 [Jannaschia pohangensis]
MMFPHLTEGLDDMAKLTRIPPVTLHLGAHRTGTTTLQRLMTRNAALLARADVRVWGPERTRDGMLAGVVGDPGRVHPRRDVLAHRAAGRVAMLRSEMSRQGVSRLILTDENFLGGLRENLLMGRLYPTAGPRLDRLALALPGVDRVVLSIRSLDTWWASCFAFLITRGFAPPDATTIEAVLRARRSWRDVITDVAAVFPAARLTVWQHEEMAAAPLRACADLSRVAPAAWDGKVLNASRPLDELERRLHDEGCPTTLPQLAGHYAPFTPDQRATLRARYDEDLAWLSDGAGGLIPAPNRPPAEGHIHDRRPGHGRPPQQMDATG